MLDKNNYMLFEKCKMLLKFNYTWIYNIYNICNICMFTHASIMIEIFLRYDSAYYKLLVVQPV